MALRRDHEKVLKDHHFEHAGCLADVLASDQWNELRVMYAITDPTGREVVHVGETEQGRNLRARLNAHMKALEKTGLVEKESDVYVHVMVTEYVVH